jgi:transposase
MLQITPQMRILVAVEAVDFRKGIDSLAELCRAKLDADPFSGCLFVFRSRRATSIKVLVYDSCEVPRYVELTLARASLSSF